MNPVKESLHEDIQHYCKRNLHLDAINDKNKNIAVLAKQKKSSNTQKEVLLKEISDLKKMTDKSVKEATKIITEIEQEQIKRKSAAGFFVTVVPQLTGKIDM